MSFNDLMDVLWDAQELAADKDRRERLGNKKAIEKDERQEIVFCMRLRGVSTKLLAKIRAII